MRTFSFAPQMADLDEHLGKKRPVAVK